MLLGQLTLMQCILLWLILSKERTSVCTAEIASFFVAFAKVPVAAAKIYNLVQKSPLALKAWNKINRVSECVRGIRDWVNDEKIVAAAAVKAFFTTLGLDTKKLIFQILGTASCAHLLGVI